MTDEKKKPSTLPFNIGAALCFAVAIGVMGYWISQGSHFVTQYQILVTETVEDEFGGETETEVRKDEFRFGLMPDKGYDGALPIGGGFAGLGALLFGIGWWKRRKGADETPSEPNADGEI